MNNVQYVYSSKHNISQRNCRKFTKAIVLKFKKPRNLCS